MDLYTVLEGVKEGIAHPLLCALIICATSEPLSIESTPIRVPTITTKGIMNDASNMTGVPTVVTKTCLRSIDYVHVVHIG